MPLRHVAKQAVLRRYSRTSGIPVGVRSTRAAASGAEALTHDALLVRDVILELFSVLVDHRLDGHCAGVAQNTNSRREQAPDDARARSRRIVRASGAWLKCSIC